MPENAKPDLDKYAEDLRQIRFMLERSQERPLLESWAFFTWVAVFAIAMAIHWSGYRSGLLGMHEALVSVWLPALVFGALLESAAFVLRFAKDRVPLFSHAFVKLMLCLMGFFVAGSALLLAIIEEGPPVPAIFPLFISVSFFVIGGMSYSVYYLVATGELLAGIVFLTAGWRGPEATLAAGIFGVLAFLAGGILSLLAERRRHG